MSDNIDKKQHGENRQVMIEEILSTCIKSKLITKYETKVQRWGEPGCNPKQFYAPFLVFFPNSKLWIIYSSTSPRDRMKEFYWDTYNIKRLDNTIESSIFVYPSKCKEEDRFRAIRKDFESGELYCDIDFFISSDELFDLIQDYALNGLIEGSRRGRSGNNFEKLVAAVLSSKGNFNYLQTKDPLECCHRFDMFTTILEKIGRNESIDIKSINKITASTQIPQLPSKGKAKTDVILHMQTSMNTYKTVTISCKKTSDDWVSFHEYSYEDFCDVLNPNDMKLKLLLKEFQRCGGPTEFGESNAIALENALTPYHNKLNYWVLGGNGGQGNPNTQWARYLLCHSSNTKEISIHTINEYIDILQQNNICGQFGTLFKWTFASGRKGKSIQLKGRVIF